MLPYRTSQLAKSDTYSAICSRTGLHPDDLTMGEFLKQVELVRR